jgi:recombination protein RecA
MAKQPTKPSKPSNEFGFSKISSVIDNLSKKSMIIVDNMNEERSYISTDVYTLNALLSKSILHGGIPKNRITILAGEYSTGKSYICYNIMRNAQKEGYKILFLDTEYSIDRVDFESFGVDVSDSDKFQLIRCSRIENVKIALVQIIDALIDLKEQGVDVSKTLIIIDSLGQLHSGKEKEDALKGETKTDMTRAKIIKSMLRLITNDLGYLNIPLVATNHVYLTQDLFPQTKQSGGEATNYTPSIVVYLSASKVEDKDKDELSLGSSGILVTARARKNRIAKPKKIKFSIDPDSGCNRYEGLDFFCTPENFEKVGIAQVKQVVDKKTGEVTYESAGTKARWYVKHLDKYLYEKNLYNGSVFTKDVLEALEPIIYEYFRYSSYEEKQKIEEEMNKLYSQFEEDPELEIDSDGMDDTLLK